MRVPHRARPAPTGRCSSCGLLGLRPALALLFVLTAVLSWVLTPSVSAMPFLLLPGHAERLPSLGRRLRHSLCGCGGTGGTSSCPRSSHVACDACGAELLQTRILPQFPPAPGGEEGARARGPGSGGRRVLSATEHAPCLSVPFVCAFESPVSRASPGPVSERTFQITCAAARVSSPPAQCQPRDRGDSIVALTWETQQTHPEWMTEAEPCPRSLATLQTPPPAPPEAAARVSLGACAAWMNSRTRQESWGMGVDAAPSLRALGADGSRDRGGSWGHTEALVLRLSPRGGRSAGRSECG